MENTNETLPFNRNDKQQTFNQIKGVIHECNCGDTWCSFTLSVGHENQRLINLAVKKHQYDVLVNKYPIGTKVNVMFYLTSRYKNERWYTTANILQMDFAD
jgi:hypothetical protein